MKLSALKYVLLTIIAICLIKKSYQIFFVLDPYESKCVSKLVHANSVFSGVFFVSGEDESGTNAEIRNPQGNVVWSVKSYKNASFNLQVEKEGKNKHY